jgi:hypothetical protein
MRRADRGQVDHFTIDQLPPIVRAEHAGLPHPVIVVNRQLVSDENLVGVSVGHVGTR